MPSFKSILVPIDFSDQSVHVLKYALSWASIEHANIEVLYVNELTSLPFGSSSYPFGVVTFPELEKEINEWADEEYRKILAHFDDAEKSRLEFKILSGKSSDMIVRSAKDNQFDLIIMASHSHSKVEKFFLGSTTERILRITDTPVIILREPDISPHFPPSHIVLLTDYSKESFKVFEHVGDFCRRIHAKITVLSVDAIESSYLSKIDDKTKDELNQLLHSEDVHVEWVKERSADPVDGILDYIDQRKPDVVAMTTHGRSGLSHLIMGSTTESIIRQVRVPIFVVRL